MVDLPIALLLPGQGAQYQGMAVALYGREPVFTATLDEFFEFMGAEGGLLRDDWLGDSPGLPIDHGSRAQPLLFAIDYAMAKVLESRGVRIAAVLGHSVGELAAAALAGVYDLAAAARILAARSEVLTTAPPGGMLAVAASPELVRSHLDPKLVAEGVVVGAVNAPQQTVLSGPELELTATDLALQAKGLTTRRVRALEPFHSPVLDAAAARFEEAVACEELRPPVIPVWSARTGRRVQAYEAVRPGFWARQLAEPVIFWSALSGLLGHGDFTLVEAGPGKGLSTVARRHPSVRSGRSEVLALLPTERGDVWSTWVAALDRLDELVAVGSHTV